MNTLKLTATAFAALDFADEEARIAALEASRAEIDAAVATAEARIAAIDAELREPDDADGRAVADALLDGADVAVATRELKAKEALEEERRTLNLAVRDLRRRSSEVWPEIKGVRAEARAQAAEAVAPLVENIVAEARAHAEGLRDAYASLAAINGATDAGHFETDQLRKAMAALFGLDALMPFQRSAQVPEEIVAVLSPLSRMPALHTGVAHTVAMP